MRFLYVDVNRRVSFLDRPFAQDTLLGFWVGLRNRSLLIFVSVTLLVDNRLLNFNLVSRRNSSRGLVYHGASFLLVLGHIPLGDVLLSAEFAKERSDTCVLPQVNL